MDIERLKRASKKIYIEGLVNNKKREALIEEAIEGIQNMPKEFMKVQYFGIKNYASFGDQREDHLYYYGPRHGSIVFKIGRADHNASYLLGEDEIYYLLVARDNPKGFGVKKNKDGREYPRDLNDFLSFIAETKKNANEISAIIEAQKTKEHEGER